MALIKTSEGFDFSKIRVLIVDDQDLVRTLLAQILRQLGVKSDALMQAADGVAATRILDARLVNLVLCDVQMDPMNGMELLKAVRCGLTAQPSNMPFVFLSGHADRHNVTLAGQLHADGFIVKPPRPSDAEKVITIAMTRPRPPEDPSLYFEIIVESEGLHGPPARTSGPVISQKTTHYGLAVQLSDARSGMLLAQDVRSRDGHLLLPRGTTISPEQVAALRDFRERYGVAEIYIMGDASATK